MPLYFAYGVSNDPVVMRSEAGEWNFMASATLPDYAYTFTGHHPQYRCGTSTIVPMRGATVLGTAYEIGDGQLDAIAVNAGPGYVLREHRALIDKAPKTVHTVEAEHAGAPNPPSAEYVERVRAGLSQRYPAEVVDAYLTCALKRCRGTVEPICKSPTPESFTDEYGCDFRRLFPWSATKTTTFGSAWAVIKPGSASTPHSHDEEETFIFLSGRGRMSVDGKERDVARGDAVYLEPFTAHTVRNVDDVAPLEFLCIWWGGAPTDPVPARLSTRQPA